MSEDNSFKAVDRQKFKGWLKKWMNARIPLHIALFIEILSPAKALSLAFQSEDIDIVSSISKIEAAKKQLKRLGRVDAHDLPTVKRFIDKVEEIGGKFTYQNVTLHSFPTAKESLHQMKGEILANVTSSLENRLEMSENQFVLSASTILNCEGWERYDENSEEDIAFADDDLTSLYDHFKIPLVNAGLTGKCAI